MILHATAVVSLFALLAYFWMATRVAVTRQRTGILAPATTGDPVLERTIRAHLKTLEWLPIFLTALSLFAFYWGDRAAAVIGMIWVLGGIIYFRGYVKEVAKRAPGFVIQALAAGILVIGVLARALYQLATG